MERTLIFTSSRPGLFEIANALNLALNLPILAFPEAVENELAVDLPGPRPVNLIGVRRAFRVGLKLGKRAIKVTTETSELIGDPMLSETLALPVIRSGARLGLPVTKMSVPKSAIGSWGLEELTVVWRSTRLFGDALSTERRSAARVSPIEGPAKEVAGARCHPSAIIATVMVAARRQGAFRTIADKNRPIWCNESTIFREKLRLSPDLFRKSRSPGMGLRSRSVSDSKTSGLSSDCLRDAVATPKPLAAFLVEFRIWCCGSGPQAARPRFYFDNPSVCANIVAP